MSRERLFFARPLRLPGTTFDTQDVRIPEVVKLTTHRAAKRRTGTENGELPALSFTLGLRLGSGASSMVYRVTADGDVTLHGSFAGKFLRPTATVESDILREAQMMAAIPPSPFIVRFLGAFSIHDDFDDSHRKSKGLASESTGAESEEDMKLQFFILQERCNCTLASLIQSMPFPEPEAAFATHALLKAVAHLHSLRIVHRDIKDGNLMVAEMGGKLCLGDFGMASYIPANSEEIPWVCGTPGYMAPEVLQNQRGGFSADLFACGACLHLLLTRSHAFAAETPLQTKMNTLRGHLPLSPDTLRLFRSEASTRLLYAMLQKEDRPSALEALDYTWLTGDEIELRPLSSLMRFHHLKDSDEASVVGTRVPSQSASVLSKFFSKSSSSPKAGKVVAKASAIMGTLGTAARKTMAAFRGPARVTPVVEMPSFDNVFLP